MPPTSRGPSRPTPSPPTREHLQRSLEELHAQLASSSGVDTRSRALLHEVLDDIRRLLAAPEQRAAEHSVQTAPRRLSGLAVEFEARHPVLAGSLRQFVDLLGQAGL